MTGNADSDTHLSRWLNGEITREEAKELLGDDLTRYEQILQEVSRWEVPSRSLGDPQRITSAQSRVVPMHRYRAWMVAASLLITLVAAWWLLSSPGVRTYHAGHGQTQEILLPDGSSVAILASNATLTLNPDLWESGNRTLELDGRGFFSVAKGGTFLVNTRNGKVEVLGTEFTVEIFDRSLEIICYEGKVRGKSMAGREVTVVAGEKRLCTEGEWEEAMAVRKRRPEWLTDEQTHFKNAPLAQVIKALADTYDLTIDFSKIHTDRRFSGSFPNDDLSAALKLVFEPLEITYVLKGKKLTLEE